MTSITVQPETRDTVMALKEDFGFENAGDFLDAACAFVEENADAFEEFSAEDEEEEED